MNIRAQEFRELLNKYLNNTASPEEREILDRFFDSYQSGLSEHPFQDSSSFQEEILQEVHTRIRVNANKRKNKAMALWLPLAAVISLFVLAYFFTDGFKFGNKRAVSISVVEERTSPGQKTVTRLPDGSIVYLNGDSKISYSSNFGEVIREVTVRGEAYFEVIKSHKPFIVHAGRIRTKVLGTAFNVKNRTGDRVEVTLVEGQVNVITASGVSSILSPNERAVVEFPSGKIFTHEVNTFVHTSWKDNILFFEHTSLKDAVATIETWYGVKIDILNPALEECVITAKYQDEPLGNVLGSFQFLLDLTITRVNERHYAFDGTGCK